MALSWSSAYILISCIPFFCLYVYFVHLQTGCVAVDGEGEEEEQRWPDTVPPTGCRGASHALLRHNNNNNNNHNNNNYNNNSSSIMESCEV